VAEPWVELIGLNGWPVIVIRSADNFALSILVRSVGKPDLFVRLAPGSARRRGAGRAAPDGERRRRYEYDTDRGFRLLMLVTFVGWIAEPGR
jgi:hypothetical protein